MKVRKLAIIIRIVMIDLETKVELNMSLTRTLKKSKKNITIKHLTTSHKNNRRYIIEFKLNQSQLKQSMQMGVK
jgi:hypothetical protein